MKPQPVTLHRFFKRPLEDSSSSEPNVSIPPPATDSNVIVVDQAPLENPPTKFQRIESVTNVGGRNIEFERDPAKRRQIAAEDPNKQDEIRRKYLSHGPYQPLLTGYKKSGAKSHSRRFQASWYSSFSWLEYSPSKDAAFCLPCFLFRKPPGCRFTTQNTFVEKGFDNWRKVKSGNDCSFLHHEGTVVNSSHKLAQKACDALMDQANHIDTVVENFTSEERIEHRRRLKISIDIIKWLTFQSCALRGHDESASSSNRGNFLEMLNFLCSYNDSVAESIQKAPKNATYTAPSTQKEILHVLSNRVKKAIRAEIGDAKYCVLVDEARDESKKEQMSIVLRFVDNMGFVRERFFGLVHVSDTTSSSLKDALYSNLANHTLDIKNIRGQGYDGASNMRGEFNGLQAQVLKDSEYGYYIHCFAHRLQLALVATSKEVIVAQKFFTKLSSIINIVGASCKRHDELQAAQASDIAHLLAAKEIKSGRGLNQIGTLNRAGDTRWSSHLKSISSLIQMFSATCAVLLIIIENGATSSQRGEADSSYEVLISFEFVFILHLMRSIMKITDLLCQALQCQSQDIVNAMQLVSSTKLLLKKFKEGKWVELLNEVKDFSVKRDIDIPDMSSPYVVGRGRPRLEANTFSIEYHYRVHIFEKIIDYNIKELDYRFSEGAMELITLGSALDPQDASSTLRIDDICQLVNKYYEKDFTDFERTQLRMQLEQYEQNICHHPDYKKLSSLSELSQWMVKLKKSLIYQLVYRVITLVLTLPVSTASTERSFSAMKLVKTRLRNKMEDEFLTDSLIVYIEKEIAKDISVETIMDDFRDLKKMRVLL